MPDARRILVIGGTGFIGRAFLNRLSHEAYELRVVSRDPSFVCEGADMRYGNIEDRAFCAEIVRDVDVIYYLAGKRDNIYHHTTKPFTYFASNVDPLLTLLSVLKDRPAGHLIYVSSVLVEYLNDGTDQDGYLQGKAMCERALALFAQEHSSWRVDILRSAAVYGPGDCTEGDGMTFIPSMIRKILDAKDELVVWGKGERRLQFVYIDDLVDNLIAVLTTQISTPVIAIGNEESQSILEITNALMRILDRDLKIVHDLNKPDKETRLSEFTNLIAPKHSLDEGLVLAVNDVLSRKVN